jgi:hypothetical protein
MLYNILPIGTLDLNQEFFFKKDQSTIYVFKGIEVYKPRPKVKALKRVLYSKKDDDFMFRIGLKDVEIKNGKAILIDRLVKVMK